MKNDLISRQAVLEVTSRECHELRGVYADIEQAINNLPSAEQTEWIPVSERLPETDELVLVTWKRNGKGKAYVSKFRHEMDGCFFDYESTPYGTDEVLAWMPLPKPYKAGE